MHDTREDETLEGLPVYEFQDLELDTDLRRLGRGPQKLRVGGMPLDVLTYLVRNPGRVVSKDELLEQVWNQAHRSRSTVPTTIGILRKVLGDDPKDPRFIESVPGRGYRFLPDVEVRLWANPAKLAHEHPLEPGSSHSIFVGREPEMAMLERNLQAIHRGHSRCTLVYGEAGVGKTRLLDEFIRVAQAFGATCAFARCWESDGAPALWPWGEILRNALVGLDSLVDRETLRRSLRSSADASRERFRLFEEVAGSLRESLRRKPCVLVFDDLHRADLTSLRLLRFILRELWRDPLLVVGTCRDDASGSTEGALREISELGREEGVQICRLQPLAFPHVRHLVEQREGPSPEAGSLAERIYESAGGNPFLVNLLLSCVDAGAAGRLPHNGHAGQIPLPRTVRRLLLDRVGGLHVDTCEALDVGAVVGRSFSVSVLAGVLGVSVKDASERLAPATAANILSANADVAGGYAFTHALVRDAIYAEIDPLLRSKWHLRVAETLEELHADDHTPVAAELAHHFGAGAEAGGAPRAIHFGAMAAEAATARCAYEEAARQCRKTLRLLDGAQLGTPRVRLECLLQLGEAEIQGGDREAGRASLGEAARIARGLGDAKEFARAAMSFSPGPLSIEVGVYDPLLVSLLSDAIELSDGGSPARIALMARLSQALAWANDEDRRFRLSEEALRKARAAGDAALVAEALIAQHRTRGGPEGLSERLSIASELGELAIELRDPTLVLMHRILRITGLLEKGQIAALDEEVKRFSTEAEEWGFGYARWYVPLFEAMRALLEGRLGDAAVFAEEVRIQGLHANDHNAVQSYGAHRATQLWELGQAAQAVALLQRYKERYPGTRAWGCALAFCQLDAGDSEGARRSFEQVAANEFEDVPRNEMWTLTLLTAAIACAWLGDRPRAARLYELLRPGAAQFGVLGFGVISFGSLSHYLGMLAGTMSRWEAADRHFSDALQLNSRLGALPWVAHSHLERARCLLSRGAVAEALAEASEAEKLARRLGLVNVARKAGAVAAGSGCS